MAKEDFDELFGSLNVRMQRKQKKAFRDYVAQKSKQMNYKCKEDKHALATNVVVGDLDSAKYVFTAHYDTPPRLPRFFTKHMSLYTALAAAALVGICYSSAALAFELTKSPEIMETVFNIAQIGMYGTIGLSTLHVLGFLGTPNPTNYDDNTSGCYALLKLMQEYENLPYASKKQVAFIFFDNEEKGLIGSLSHRLKHKKNLKGKTYINLDCVGRGDQMNLYHFGKKPAIVEELQAVLKTNKLFKAEPKKSNIISSMSDHFSFKDEDHVTLLSVDSKNPKSLYGHIHSSADDYIDKENIDNIVETINELSFIKNLDKGEDSESPKKKIEVKKNNPIQAEPDNE